MEIVTLKKLKFTLREVLERTFPQNINAIKKGRTVSFHNGIEIQRLNLDAEVWFTYEEGDNNVSSTNER